MWDILYAVDASSSMADNHRSTKGTSFVKIDLVRQAVADLVDSGLLPFSSRIGLLTFNAPTRMGGMFLKGGEEMTRVVLPMTPIEGLTKESASAKLSEVQIGGATPSGIAIEQGLRVLYETKEGPIKRIKKLVMITDEKSNVGPKPEKVVNDEVARKAIIDVIAIGSKINKETLEIVSAKTGGKFMVVESAEELLQAMKPRIDVPGLGVDASLLADVGSAEKELQGSKPSGASSMQYRKALERAREVRARANKRLMQVLMIRSQAEADVKTLVSQLDNGLSMQEYARRMWPRAAELDQAEKVERELRASMEKLAA